MRKAFAIAIAIAATLAGCYPPKILVSEELVGQRSVKYIVQRTDPYYDLTARVCDFDGDGNEVNCKDTLLLGNVAYRPAPHHFPAGQVP